MEKKSVLNSKISVGSCKEFIDEIFNLVKFKVPSYVCFANVHMVVEAYKDEAFQKVVNNANIVTPDGKPISIFLRLFNGVKQSRVCGMDMLPDLLKTAEATGRTVYFYGTTMEVLDTIREKARKEFPLINISGCYAPPFRDLSKEEKEDIIFEIKRASPDLIFVSLGCPKQEFWMAEHRDKLNACLLGVGQAFKTYAGLETRLPVWMRDLSLEWLYRLYLEPGRLWKRYLFTNSYFLVLTLRHAVTRLLNECRAFFARRRVLQKIDE